MNKVYDVLGRFVVEVKDKDSCNGIDIEGKEVKTGVDFLKADGKTVCKVVKVR